MTAPRLPGDTLRGALPARHGWHHRFGMPQNPFIALMCCAVVAGIWLVTLQRIASERDQAVAAAMRSNANLAIAFEQQLFRTLKAAEQVAAFVREQYRERGEGIDLRQWVERGTIRERMFTVISVLDETGAVVSSSETVGNVNYIDREFFRAQREAGQDRLFVSHPVVGRVTGRWQVPMSLRISRPDGGFGGVVVVSVDPANFTDFYRQADLGAQGLLELSGLDGVVRGRKIGSQHSFGLEAGDLAWFQRRAVMPEGQFVDDGQAVDGVRRIVSYRSMAGYPLMVAVGSVYADDLAPAAQRRMTYLAMASAATVVMLVFAALLMSMLARQRKATDALRASEALFSATFHQAAMGIAHIAPDGRMLGANEKFCRMLGYRHDELLEHTVFDLSDEDSREEARQFLAHRLSSYSPVFSPEIEKPYRRKDGSILWVCEALGVVADARGQPAFLVAVTQDITARKDLEARLSHEALHDALTGLPNRVMFQDQLTRVLKAARRHERLAAILYIDLDGFKAVNDSRGHAAGDVLLRLVARRLEACVRADDTVARFGGDEFGIVLASLAQPGDCEVVALKVIEVLAKPFDLAGEGAVGGAAVHISASVGAALFPTHGLTAAALLAYADAAMYAAKRTGKNRFCWAPLGSGETSDQTG